jgi:Family of unknown function (DUF6326)
MNGDHIRDRKLTFAMLWIFVLFNYVYADFGTFAMILMRPQILERFQGGQFGSVTFTGWFMLAAAALMEIPIGMVLLSWLLEDRANRRANVAAGTIMTLVILVTLLGAGKVPADFYTFFQVVEIAATATIVGLAWRWRGPAVAA